MRATCQDLIGSGIHAAMVCPGFTDTEMLKQHLGGDTDLMVEIGSKNGLAASSSPRRSRALIPGRL